MTAGEKTGLGTGPEDQGIPEDPYARSRELAQRAAGFADMDDAQKVEFSQTELGACAALLDDLLTRFAALRTEVADPDGRVRFTLGNDGRLLELFIDEPPGASMTRRSWICRSGRPGCWSARRCTTTRPRCRRCTATTW